MRRLLLLLSETLLVGPLALMSQSGIQPAPSPLDSLFNNCEYSGLCPDTFYGKTDVSEYIGHDEPALLFYSKEKGSGRSSFYTLRLPKEPPTQPKQDGSGGVYNFQLRATFWFGMAICDTQSAPNPDPLGTCNPGTDDNIFDNPDPNAEDYIGKHPGTAFLELQFYPPGWALGGQGLVSDTEWFAALTISSVSQNQNTLQNNNANCRSRVGVEPQNGAVITKNGIPLRPANPLRTPFGIFSFDLSNVLVMFGGDVVKVGIFDTPAGVKVTLDDVTTGQSGFMIGGPAQGFGQVDFQPSASTCTVTPYAFHPMYDTSSEHTRVPWAAHTYNIAFSDEIGHFEFCDAFATSAPHLLHCTVQGVDDVSLDADDFPCFNPSFFNLPSTYQQITGCVGSDLDFDGTSYRLSWPGTVAWADATLHSEPILFSSAQFHGPGNSGLRDYDRVAFEADMPAIEPPSICALDGTGCVNPPPGAIFYPIFSTTRVNGRCMWQFGGPNIPGTTNNFGGNSIVEYGGLLSPFYSVGGSTFFFAQDYRQILHSNPCEVGNDGK